ncbi:MAG: ATP-binding protein [Myxococcota bacterium]|nr:ATP-binding protein [Myxococcota bacterium]
MSRLPPQKAISRFSTAVPEVAPRGTAYLAPVGQAEIHALPPAGLHAAFPFHLVVDGELRILQLGAGLEKLCPSIARGQNLSEVLELRQPKLPSLTAKALLAYEGEPICLAPLATVGSRVELRGQIVPGDEDDTLFLLISPWATDLSSIRSAGLNLTDFAAHDRIADYLVLLQTRDVGLAEIHNAMDKLVEQQSKLEEARREAEKAYLAKSEFLSCISHELRNPLNGVCGLIELLSKLDLQSDALDYIQPLRQTAHSLSSIVNELFEFQCLENPHVDLNPEDFTAASLLGNISTLFLAQLSESEAEHNLKIRIEVDDSVPSILRGDASRLRQILSNLVHNAIKFTQQGEIVVGVRERSRDSGSTVIEFSVTDTGSGIAPAVQQKIFHPYTRVSSAGEASTPGAGLGLAICERIVRAMGGEISVRSQLGVGSQFFFTVPLTIISTEETSNLISIGNACSGKPKIRSGARALVVEDNEINQMISGEMLGLLGIDHVVAPSGREAIALFESQDFDVVLLDYRMPDLDGPEIAECMRSLEARREQRTPIIALTGNIESKARSECLASGMNSYLAKPVTLEGLSKALDAWLPAPKPMSKNCMSETIYDLSGKEGYRA